MMSCECFRKYIDAFADGELDVQKNLEVLEHLNMCPGCAGRVTDVTALKAALKRTYSSVQAPRTLRDRVRSLLDARAELPKITQRLDRSGGRASQRSRLAVPLAMAASLIVAVLLWQHWPQTGSPAALTVVAEHIVADVRQQHRLCTGDGGLDHHDEALPRDPVKIAEVLRRDLGLAVFVPDWTARGFKLVGADRCGVMGRKGSHILYRSVSSGVMLSAFTVGRLVALNPTSDGQTVDGGCFVSSDDSPAVVAWHDGPQTHILCAELPDAALLDLVGTTRTAGAGRTVGLNPALALIR